jgi:hypothetical protein
MANQINNDDIHQGSEVVSSDKDVHLLLSVAREKVGNLLLNMCSTLQNNNYDNDHGLLYVHPTKAVKQIGI